MTKRFAARSERDFVASVVRPRLEEASRVLGVSDVVEFHVEQRVNGVADLTAEKAGRRLFVLEAKFKKKVGRVERDIEPRDPEVIDQALRYASWGGFPYYLTCNAKRVVLFQLKPPLKPFESEIASFEYEARPGWAEEVLKLVLELVPVRLKPLDDTLVDTLHEAFNDLYPEFLSALKERFKGKGFRDRYVEWLESQGVEFSDESTRSVAAQTTYLQLNKLLFYQVIRVIYPDRLSPLEVGDDEAVSDALNRFYADARAIDYAPVYEGDIISEVPFTVRAEERIRTLLDTLSRFDFSEMESDFLGRVYEKLISPLERKRLGQFYTPPRIVDFIIRLTLKNADARVLDPGCGSGSFLVRAYHALRELNGIPRQASGGLGERFHQQLLEQIFGVDINQFPAHLSVINLAVQNPKAMIDRVNVMVSDIFDIKPGNATLSGFAGVTAEGKPALVELPPSFDLVVANPPYIRQELLGDKEKSKIRDLIESSFEGKVFIGAPRKKVKDAIVLDKQSDIYIYFFIQGIRLLKNGGHLGFISSNKWLEVGYGEPFQRFLLDHAKIRYVIEFDRAVFPDAEVDTAITILEKEDDPRRRNDNQVKFVRIKQKMNLDSQLKFIQETKQSVENENLRVNVIRQMEMKIGRWNVYLRAPSIYQHIITNPKICQMSEIAEIIRGPTTGYNDYFILSREKAEEWGIEKKYLRLCVRSPRNLKNLIIESTHINEYLLVVNKNKEELSGTNVVRYLEHGEKFEVNVIRGSRRGIRRLPNRETLKNRKPFWYSLPDFDPPQILFPRMLRERFVVFLNDAKCQTPHVFVYIYTKKDNDKVLAGYLNSSLSQLFCELTGRQYTGMLNMETEDIKRLFIINPLKITNREAERISKAFSNLASAVKVRTTAEAELNKSRGKTKQDLGLFEEEAKQEMDHAIRHEHKARKELDNTIYDVLGLTKIERLQVEHALKELQELRRLRTRV